MKWINKKTVQGDPMDTKNYSLPKEERHGHWIPYEYGDYHWHKCSICGVADKYIETVHRDGYIDKDMESIRHYCPNCGAKMEEIVDAD